MSLPPPAPPHPPRPPKITIGFDSETGKIQVDANDDSKRITVQIDGAAARRMASVLNAMADVAEKK